MSVATKPVAPLVTGGAHLVARVEGRDPGPMLLVVGGIHGNEPAGVLAARRVLSALRALRPPMRGTLVMLAGNTRALARRVRYVGGDLNRQWTAHNLEALGRGDAAVPEREDLSELHAELDRAFEDREELLFVLDLHTTSADGAPFATIGDTLYNRAFAEHFPLPIILGLEEQLEGTMLEYANERGAVTLGVEAGRHDLASSVDHHEAVIWLALVAAGLLRREDAPELAKHEALLARAGGGTRFVEVLSRHAVTPEDGFRMEPGFANFAPVRRGQALARDRRGVVRAPRDGLVLLPLYQTLGDDGFFLGREVRGFWLRLSASLRRARVGRLMPLLPGVRRRGDLEGTLEVDTRVARVFPLQLFHLLGFRKRRWEGNTLVVTRRRHDIA